MISFYNRANEMGSTTGTSEIVESKDEIDLFSHPKRLNPIKVKSPLNEVSGKHLLSSSARCSIEEELNQLIEAIDKKTRGLVFSNQSSIELECKNPQKRPMRVGITHSPGIGISEAVTLKQALRGLCISQASEMAAMKRSSKPDGLAGLSEAGTIRRLYQTVVVESNDKGGTTGDSLTGVASTLPSSQEITFKTPKAKVRPLDQKVSSSPSSAGKLLQASKLENLKQTARSPHSAVITTLKAIKIDKQWKSLDITPSPETKCRTPIVESTKKGKPKIPSSTLSSNTSSGVRTLNAKPCNVKQSVRTNNMAKKQVKQDLKPASGKSFAETAKADGGPSKTTLGCNGGTGKKTFRKEPMPSRANHTNFTAEQDSKSVLSVGSKKLEVAVNNSSCGRITRTKMPNSRLREKGDCSHSSKSSNGECSSSPTISDDSNLSGSFNGARPHMSKDLRWEAIRHVEMQHGCLGLRHYKLLKRLGCGDIGTVYLAQLNGTTCLFALKVMDNDFLASRKKMSRAQTERDILQILDHPFLPTLYSHFRTDKLSCLVMDYCPGGDLHVLRQKQPGRYFPEQAARFYAAEVLLALEYLHMLGVIYRDLKPENILVREDGHIMLTDFDLSLRCAVSPTLLKTSSPVTEPAKKEAPPCTESPCIDPLCLQPSWAQMSCFTPRLLTTATKIRKLKSEPAATQASLLPQLVAEPTEARSNSFVGTHEYLAPEIIKGEGHGSAVDWWTFGIFVYELLFGRTPFKGLGNEDTLNNVVSQSLHFPESPAISFSARDLIRGLLVKEPEKRLGSARGATEIKHHPFFEGLNWALIRCAIPPDIPNMLELETLAMWLGKKESRSIGEHLEFEVF